MDPTANAEHFAIALAFTFAVILLALQAIKTLGRNPIGSEVLARPRVSTDKRSIV